MFFLMAGCQAWNHTINVLPKDLAITDVVAYDDLTGNQASTPMISILVGLCNTWDDTLDSYRTGYSITFTLGKDSGWYQRSFNSVTAKIGTVVDTKSGLFKLTLVDKERGLLGPEEVEIHFETIDYLRCFQANLDMLKVISKDAKLTELFNDSKLFIMTKNSTSLFSKKHDKRFIRALGKHETNAKTGKAETLYRINKSNKPNGSGMTVKRTDKKHQKKRKKHSKSDIDWYMYVDNDQAKGAAFLGNERENFDKAHRQRQEELESDLKWKKELCGIVSKVYPDEGRRMKALHGL